MMDVKKKSTANLPPPDLPQNKIRWTKKLYYMT